MKKCIVIAGFPGVGKTVAAEKNRYWVDLESTAHHWFFDPEHPGEPPKENPAWPGNYVDAIECADSPYGCTAILVSTHREVREEMHRRGIEFIIVAPTYRLKSEYLARYLKRGSDYEFIRMMEKRWGELLEDLLHDGAPVIWMGEPENTLEDILPK